MVFKSFNLICNAHLLRYKFVWLFWSIVGTIYLIFLFPPYYKQVIDSLEQFSFYI